MASECAMLGTPAIYINPIQAGSIDEQEIYGLLCHFSSGEGILEKVRLLLKNETLKEDFFERKEKVLNEKIDLTAFLVWFCEKWPESFKITKKTPDYQFNFK